VSIDDEDDHMMKISDPVLSKSKAPVQQGPIDYSSHGENWISRCTEYSEEQSPLNLSWEEAEANPNIHFDMLYTHAL